MEETHSERDRAPKKKKKKKRDITIAFSLSSGSKCFLFSVRCCRRRRRRLRREERAGSQRKKKKTDFRWTEREREKRYHLTEISLYLSIYLEFNDGTEENPHRAH